MVCMKLVFDDVSHLSAICFSDRHLFVNACLKSFCVLLQKADIPRHGFFNALLDGVLRVVAQQIVGFADIGL